MSVIEIHPLEPTYTRNNGGWALDVQQILPQRTFTPVEQILLYMPPNSSAGNHRHSRREALVAIGAGATFLWQDDDGNIHREKMNPDGQLRLFIIGSHVPHAVQNTSSDDQAILYEYFDTLRQDTKILPASLI